MRISTPSAGDLGSMDWMSKKGHFKFLFMTIQKIRPEGWGSYLFVLSVS